jgi:hypothetical protein
MFYTYALMTRPFLLNAENNIVFYLELRQDIDKGILLYFPLGGTKTDDCTWVGSLLVSVAVVCGTREKGVKTMGKEKKMK